MWLNWHTAAVELEVKGLDFRIQSRGFKIRDASFQNSFQRMLTYHIFSPHCTNLQNPSCVGTEISIKFVFHNKVSLSSWLFLDLDLL